MGVAHNSDYTLSNLVVKDLFVQIDETLVEVNVALQHGVHPALDRTALQVRYRDVVTLSGPVGTGVGLQVNLGG